MKRSYKRNKTILVGIDYSKSSDNAVNYAAALAVKGKADIMLFHTFEIPVVHTNSGIFFISYNELRTANIQRLEKYRGKLKIKYPALNIKLFTMGASFRIELEELQRKHAVQYIVMGLQSKSRISKFIYGSHGTSVAGKMNCPVIIVPEKYRIHKIESSVVAVDNVKTVNYEVLKKVKDFNSKFKISSSFVHIKTPFEFSFDRSAKAKKLNLEVVEAGDFSLGISRYTNNRAKDMIIIVSKSHSAIYNFFNESNTKTIAFRSKIPVMAIHE